jgi:hypothetical protein
MFRFNYCQKFYLDQSAVDNANEVALTRVDIYFRSKPPAENNLSGIYKPGCELMIIPVEGGVPVINQIGAYRPTEPTEHGAKFAFYSGGEIARLEWDDIVPTLDGSTPAKFLLESPAIVKTNREYAFVVKFDGNDNFILWTNVLGEYLTGTDDISTQHSSGFQGTLYSRADNPQSDIGTGLAYSGVALDPTTADDPAIVNAPQNQTVGEFWDVKYLAGNWNEIPRTALKFKLYAARYAHNGISVSSNSTWLSDPTITSAVDRSTYVHTTNTAVISNNVLRMSAQGEPLEYVIFNKSISDKRSVFYGEPLYQDGPSFPGGVATPLTVNCWSNTTGNNAYNSRVAIANGTYTYANSTTFDAAGGWYNITAPGQFMLITSANGGISEIKAVESILSNTQILFQNPFETQFLNATFKIVPVAWVNSIAPTYAFGKAKDLVTLYDTIANSTVNFTSHSINSISIDLEGTGYSNSDYIRIMGYDDVYNNYPAYANVVTDATGNLTAIYLSNVGAGFSNSSWVTGTNVEILQSSGGTPSNTASAGSGANLIISIGTNIKSVYTGTTLRECEIVNLPTNRMKPEITVNNPVGSAFTITHNSLFHGLTNTSAPNGISYFINTTDEQNYTNTYVKIFKGHQLINNPNKFPVFPSRSNQFRIPYANGGFANTTVIGDSYSNAMMIYFNTSSNSDFQALYVDPEIVYTHYSMYVVNRNYSNEHTNYGEAWARQIQTKVNFEEDRRAEDCLVYLTAYRPSGTELLVYGKFLNDTDEDEFDDRNWTLMEQIGGNGVFSSIEDTTDFVEYTYGFPAYPNSEFTLNGTVEVWQGNAYANGTGTTFPASFTIDAGGTGYTNGDLALASPTAQTVPTTGIYATHPVYDAIGTIGTDGSGIITSITVSNGGFGWANQVVTTNASISFTNSTGGPSGGSGANVVFQPGLLANDVIKIYSPLFPNTNYTLAVVNSITNTTQITVKRTFGEVSANLTGNVSINATSNAVSGTGTLFTEDFSVGDFIAVWESSSVYQTRKVSTITNDTSMTVDSNWSIANGDTKYAYVQPSTFVNNSISVDELKIDRIAGPYEHSVYNDFLNANVATYYNTGLAQLTGYSTFQIKVVMLSNNQIIVPKIDDVRGVGVTS